MGPRKEPVVLEHKYGSELASGMRIDISDVRGIYRMSRILRVSRYDTAGLIELVMADGSVIPTCDSASWYVES